MNAITYPIRLGPIFVALGALGVWTVGCSSEEPPREASSLKSGERVVVNLETTADGSLEAQSIDVEDIDCEQEGEHEGENEGCEVPVASGDAADMIVGPLDTDSTLEAPRILGFDVAVDPSGKADGTLWVGGSYLGDNKFDGAVLKSSANERLRMLGVLQGTKAVDGRFEIRLLDRVIDVDAAMPLNTVDDLDESAESDIDCEQEGEHEGENEGC